MLQRAATTSTAGSWWWASHIRTKQSKWLHNNLKDVDEKVNSVMKLLDEDADTFAKKAEMYYKRRPELRSFIDELYKSYKAVAERYDRISGDLHKANNTIATACPDKVPFSIEDEDEDEHISDTKAELNFSPTEMSPDKAQEMLHKEIFALQTEEKEYDKSSYECGIAKYYEMEKRIMDMQEKVANLRDEFSLVIIDIDNEPLKSCKDTLVKSIEDVKFKSERIKNAGEKLRALKLGYRRGEYSSSDSSSESDFPNSSGEEVELKPSTKKFGNEKADLIDGSKDLLCERVSQAEAELQDLDNSIRDELSDKLQSTTDILFTTNKPEKDEEMRENDGSEKMDEIETEIEHKETCSFPQDNNSEDGEVIKKVLSHEARDEDDIPIASNRDSGSNWEGLLEDRDKMLFAEYMSVLRDYRETKLKLNEAEKRKEDDFTEIMTQMRELRDAFVAKDEQIGCLQQKVSLLESKNASLDSETQSDQNTDSGVKFRSEIDSLLDGSLRFWLKLSSSFHHMQRHRDAAQDLQAEISKLKTNTNSTLVAGKLSVKTEGLAIQKELKELQTDIHIWMDENAILTEEIQTRLSSLQNINKEITKASKNSGDDQLTAYDAAKFQGEVVNMQQEGIKVANELKTGLENAKELQFDIEKAVKNLNEEFQLSTVSRNHSRRHSIDFPRIPLRSFLFGVKPNKPRRSSIFSCMSPKLQRQHSDLMYY